MSFAKGSPFEQNIRPGFVGDFLNREHVLPGGVKLNASTFTGSDDIRVEVTAAVAANATTVPVVALSRDIPTDTTVMFGAPADGKFARLSEESPTGDNSLVTYPVPKDLAVGDVGYYSPPGTTKRIPAGTPVKISNTVLESSAASGALWSSAGNGIAAGTNDIVRILAYDVQDVEDNNDGDLLRKGTLLRVNHMYWDTLDATVKAKTRVDYDVTVGTPGQEVPAV